MFAKPPALLLCGLVLGACSAALAAGGAPVEARTARLEAELQTIIDRYAGDTAEIAVAFRDLETGDSLLIDAGVAMHAASTMKVPVMLQLFRLHDRGELSISDSIVLRNEFRSIADGSTYALTLDDDSEGELYGRIGSRLAIRELIASMITWSSNLATNVLIELADPERIAQTLAELGAQEMRVLRGVEDIPAFERGMNNSTTAYGFMKVLEAIASGRAASPASTAQMLAILERQQFREQIPAGVPEGVRVGNKTGWITRIQHDGAIVFPDARRPYVLVVMTRGFADREAAAAAAREISGRVYAAAVGGG